LGSKFFFVAAGYFSIIFNGRIGRFTKLPAQLGQTFLKISKAQVLQYVHSKEHIIASVDVFVNLYCNVRNWVLCVTL
tara:strand:+ start:19981 stop:20211 length:231 start_codon:yes stop_codon:yes gene_type:complete